MFRKISCLMLLVACLNGRVIAGEWVFNDGYWWQGNQAFVQVEVGRFYDRHLCKWIPRYEYRYHHTYVAPVAKQEYEEFDEDQQIKELLKLKKLQLKQEHVQTLARDLGLSDGFDIARGQPSAVSGAYGYQVQSTYQRVPLAAQGAGVYGYGVQQAYVDFADNRILLNQLANSQKEAAQLLAQSLNGTKEIAAIQQNTVKEVALAQAVAQVILASKDSETITTTQTPVTRPNGGLSESNHSAGVRSDTASAILGDRCLRCHGGEKTENGFDLSQPELLTRSQWLKIIDRVTRDGEGAMPPEGALPDAEQLSLMNAYTEAFGKD